MNRTPVTKVRAWCLATRRVGLNARNQSLSANRKNRNARANWSRRGDSNTRGVSPAVYKTAAVAAEPLLQSTKIGAACPLVPDAHDQWGHCASLH